MEKSPKRQQSPHLCINTLPARQGPSGERFTLRQRPQGPSQTQQHLGRSSEKAERQRREGGCDSTSAAGLEGPQGVEGTSPQHGPRAGPSDVAQAAGRGADTGFTLLEPQLRGRLGDDPLGTGGWAGEVPTWGQRGSGGASPSPCTTDHTRLCKTLGNETFGLTV